MGANQQANQANSERANEVVFSQNVTRELAEQIMGVERGKLGSVAWLVLQEEAAGVGIEGIAATLMGGVTVADLVLLKESVTGCVGAESDEIWARGLVALTTASTLSRSLIAKGWDAAESIALDKLNQALYAMSGTGDAMQMLTIASAANKAVRRERGEGNRGGVNVSVRSNNANGDTTLNLQTGNLGTMRLNISPRVQAQLTNPNRIIDVTPNADSGLPIEPLTPSSTSSDAAEGEANDGLVIEVGVESTAVAAEPLQMLGLSETRALMADGSPRAKNGGINAAQFFAGRLDSNQQNWSLKNFAELLDVDL